MNISDILSVIGAIGGFITVLSGAYQAMANRDKTESEADIAQGKATKIIIDSAAESVKIVQERMIEMREELNDLKATVKTNQTVLEQKSKTIESLEGKVLELNRIIVQLQNQSVTDQRKITDLTFQVEILQTENIDLKSQLQKARVIK